MILFSCKNVGLTFGMEDVLQHLDLTVNEKDRIGVVGANGAGKTSLIQILLGTYAVTEGECFVHSKIKGHIGYLAQNSGLESELTVEEECMQPFRPLIRMEENLHTLEEKLKCCTDPAEAASLSGRLSELYERFGREGGLTFRSRVSGILKGLGFDERARTLPIASLSGGQKTRLALGRVLLNAPDVLILDEPTNHLDAQSVEWLEGELNSYGGTLLVISHDRAFLNAVTSKTLLIEDGSAFLYPAPYARYAELRNQDLVYQERRWKQQQKEIARIEAFIENQRKWNRERNIIAAESRMKQLERMTVLEKPRSPEDPPPIRFEVDEPGGNDVLSVENLSFAYPGRPLFAGISLQVYRGERVFVTGPNGCGKSTFLRAIAGALSPQERQYMQGSVRIGQHIPFSYYAQDLSGLNPQNTVFDEVYDHANRARTAGERIPVPKLRSALAAFGFHGEEVFKKISALSGGEKARVVLLKISYERRPLLILDEPTNHLDIGATEVLEEALARFPGTMLVVSHDRCFCERLATRTVDITAFAQPEQAPQKTAAAAPSAASADYRAEKERRARMRKLENDRAKTLARLQELEQRVAAAERELEDPQISADYEKIAEIYRNKEALESAMLTELEHLEELEREVAAAP